MARALASLYFAGATIGAISLVLPHPAHAAEFGLWSNVALGYIAAAAIIAFGPRLPAWTFHAALLLGSLLITRAVLLGGEPVSFYAAWFIWIGLYSFYFFGRIQAAGHIAVVSALYAFTLVEQPAGSSVARWLTTVATLVVAGGFIDTLVHRARRQAEAAASSAGSMAKLAAAAHELAELSDPAAARHALCQTAADVTGARRVALWEPNQQQTELEVSACAGEEPPERSIPLLGSGEGPAGALAAGEPKSAGTTLWQPIVREGGPGAVLALDWDSRAALEEGSAASLASLLGAEVLITLNRLELLARLAAMARTDELTGLPNRRWWEEQVPREIERARREQTPVCVVMIDLDRFKDYNDLHGHQAGDRVLKQAAAAWGQELRTTDMLARYGGEEFVLMLPGCEGEQALATVERIRAATPERQACSAGIAVWDGIESAFELLGRADAALYEAKRSGRDRSMWAATEPPGATGAAQDGSNT